MKAFVVLLALAACQQTQPPPAAGSASTPAPVSSLSSPAPAPAPTPVPVEKPSRPIPPLPSPLPGKRSDLSSIVGAAQRVAIGDFDGDGHRELALADGTKLRVVTLQGKELASVPAPGGIQVLVAADVDGDGKAEILAGWGLSREHRDAPAKIARYKLEKDHLVEDTIVAPETQRAEVVAIVPVEKNAVLVAYYTSKYMVKSAIARHGAVGWDLAQIAELRMATSYTRGDLDGDGKPELVVGRVYGDAKGVDGDAFVLADGGARTPIPTTRGVHGLAIAGGTLFVGDGWHQNYADNARGLLTAVRHDASGFHAELVEDTAGQFMIEKIVPATIDGHPTIVTLGSHYVRAFQQVNGKWTGLTIAGPARDIAVGDLDGQVGDEIVVLADKPEVIDLRGVAWK